MFILKLGKWVWGLAWLIGLLIGLASTAWAQTDTTLKTPVQRAAERGELKRLRQQALKAGAIDSLMALKINTLSAQATRRDSLFYTRLKARLYKHRLTRQLYDAVFQDVYNSHSTTGEVRQLAVNPYLSFKGQTIATIYIRRLGVFGHSVYDTLRNTGNWFEKVGSRLHTNTRERVIRHSYLLFKSGDALDPTKLQDNERLLRTTAIFHDARILVVPHPGNLATVDVYVITQDVWSLLPTGGFGGFDNFSVGLEQLNFRGLGHQVSAQVAYAGSDPRQQLEYQAHYKVPFIGKTFLTAQADGLYLRDLKQASLKLYRPFINPDTKYAGSLEINHTQLNTRLLTRQDSALLIPIAYHYTDVWLGRSFRLFAHGPEIASKGRSRFIIAIRNTNYVYVQRPTVTADTNQAYQDSRTTLFSLGYSKRKYVRDVLIYAFGRTEDVPVGMSLIGIGGYDHAQLGQRLYTGLNLSQGNYIPHLGYLYSLVNLGGYFRQQRIEQGVFSLEANYFSPLLINRWGSMRHFVTTRYTTGIGRFANEYISLNTSTGEQTDAIPVASDALRGTKRFFISYENVLFSRLSLVGFRVALLSFVNLGLVSFAERSLLKGPLYQGYGIGFRLRNENLTFNSIQIRLAYYPNIPGNTTPFRQAFEAVPALRFRDFDVPAPQIVAFQ